MKSLPTLLLLSSLLFASAGNALTESREKSAQINTAPKKAAPIANIQLAVDDAGKCRADCLEQMILCKQNANAPSKDESDRRKAEEACDLNYRACVSSCK